MIWREDPYQTKVPMVTMIDFQYKSWLTAVLPLAIHGKGQQQTFGASFNGGNYFKLFERI